MALLAVWCSALLCRTKPTGKEDDTATQQGRENTQNGAQVLAASIAEKTKEKEAAAQRQAHPPPEAERGGTTSGAVGGRVQRLVVLRLVTFRAMLLLKLAQ